MFFVGKFDEAGFAIPHGHEKNARGYERAPLIDHSSGSVHMGTGICRLQPEGYTASHLHANEKGIYILEGEVELRCDRDVSRLSVDDYALIPYGIAHAFRNASANTVRWIEMQSPQPKPSGGWQDTFFVNDFAWPAQVSAPDFSDSRTRYVGHFKEQKPVVHKAAGVQGLTVHRFMEREFGSQHFYMMRGVLAAGGSRGYHDHPVEEFYFALSGETDMEIEGQRFHLRPGDVAWTGVGASHAFFQKGDAPFRWLETQAPQFPAQNGIRNYDEWDMLRARRDSEC
jgi:mannose-6-phosphate isomerase-like protein (cupin superfamily)